MTAVIDLRSDTVTLPSSEMRDAMHRAELGDDVFGEDPTVNALEELAAERTGQEAALFVTSGTQGNLVAALTHTRRGDEVICGDQCHVLLYEVAGCAALGGLQLRPVPSHRGELDLAAVRATIRGENVHYPRTGLVTVENTHNRHSGAIVDVESMRALVSLSHSAGVPVHVDGARIFNAAVARGVSVATLMAGADSITFCLSKGLGCPVGSVLCGSRDFIALARKYRKMLGAGMRQVGVLAAAGVFALNHMVGRLAEDHANARRLAQGIAGIPGLNVDPDGIDTNIVIFGVDGGTPAAERFRAEVANAGVKTGPPGADGRIRVVTHYGIDSAHIDRALAVFARSAPLAPVR